MRLKQHINEAQGDEFPSGDDINTAIHNDCKQYLKLIRGVYPMYRGMYGEYNLGTKKVRKDRKPFGMSNNDASLLNKMLQKNGHARRDKSVMCTSNATHLELFGDPFFIFPKDKLKKYTWFEGKDINMDYDVTGWQEETIEAWIEVSKPTSQQDPHIAPYYRMLDKLKKPFEEHFYTNKGFKTAHRNGWEMWIECDEYYYASIFEFKWNKSRQSLSGFEKL
jgi:hypothetical protein